MYFLSSPIRPLGALGAALALAACGGGAASQSTPESAAAAAGAPSYTVASAEEWDSLKAEGESAFATACEACHPGGGADLGPTLLDIQWSTAQMYVQIREGSGRMKPINESRLPEAQMKGLFVYLSELGAVSDVAQP